VTISVASLVIRHHSAPARPTEQGGSWGLRIRHAGRRGGVARDCSRIAHAVRIVMPRQPGYQQVRDVERAALALRRRHLRRNDRRHGRKRPVEVQCPSGLRIVTGRVELAGAHGAWADGGSVRLWRLTMDLRVLLWCSDVGYPAGFPRRFSTPVTISCRIRTHSGSSAPGPAGTPQHKTTAYRTEPVRHYGKLRS
jgi:hypothetical protein